MVTVKVTLTDTSSKRLQSIKTADNYVESAFFSLGLMRLDSAGGSSERTQLRK